MSDIKISPIAAKNRMMDCNGANNLLQARSAAKDTAVLQNAKNTAECFISKTEPGSYESCEAAMISMSTSTSYQVTSFNRHLEKIANSDERI